MLACSKRLLALVLLASGGPWYLTRDRFGQFFRRRPQSRWPTFDTRSAGAPWKKFARAHPLENASNPARQTRRATWRGGRESLQGYSRLCSTGASSPCPFGRLFFSSVRCPSRVYYRLWRAVGRGRNEDLRDGNAKYFCGFIVTHLLYSFVLARLVGFDMESNRRTCFSLVIVDCFSSFKIKLMLVIIKWFFNTCDKTIYFDYFDIKYIRRIEFILNHCILFKMSRIIV